MKKKIEINRQANFILAALLVHFLFFGFLCNVYEKDAIGNNILFLYNVMFSPTSFLSTIILFLIIFFMVYREEFPEFGIKNSIWMVGLIVIESWIWYYFIFFGNTDIPVMDYLLVIPLYFTHYESYLTILILLGINVSTAILAGYTKNKVQEYRRKMLGKPSV